MSFEKLTIGWKEWVSLPELGIPLLIAKSDSGAKTSALHAFEIHEVDSPQGPAVRFGLHPQRRYGGPALYATAPLVDRRHVKNSGGQPEARYVIRTRLDIGCHSWPILLTLTNRDAMAYRMLLGREAMLDRLLVDPAHCYLLGKPQPTKEPLDEHRHFVP